MTSIPDKTDQEQHEVYDFRKSHVTSDASKDSWQLRQPVYFVGFMGAGKTSVARKVARIASVSSIDVDSYIERRCDKKISEIFDEVGEAGFREIEKQLLQELTADEPRLIACGGGIVLAEENRALLNQNGFVIYLEVTAEEAAARISDTSTRPLFGDLEQAQKVIDGRLHLYEEVADVTLDTAQRSTGSLAYEIVDLLKQEGILWQPK